MASQVVVPMMAMERKTAQKGLSKLFTSFLFSLQVPHFSPPRISCRG